MRIGDGITITWDRGTVLVDSRHTGQSSWQGITDQSIDSTSITSITVSNFKSESLTRTHVRQLMSSIGSVRRLDFFCDPYTRCRWWHIRKFGPCDIRPRQQSIGWDTIVSYVGRIDK